MGTYKNFSRGTRVVYVQAQQQHMLRNTTTYLNSIADVQFWWENLKERGHLEDLGADGRIILKCMFISRV